MVPVVPTGTLLDGHTGSHLNIVGPTLAPLDFWVRLTHSVVVATASADPLRLRAPHGIPGLLPPCAAPSTMFILVNTPHS